MIQYFPSTGIGRADLISAFNKLTFYFCLPPEKIPNPELFSITHNVQSPQPHASTSVQIAPQSYDLNQAPAKRWRLFRQTDKFLNFSPYNIVSNLALVGERWIELDPTLETVYSSKWEISARAVASSEAPFATFVRNLFPDAPWFDYQVAFTSTDNNGQQVVISETVSLASITFSLSFPSSTVGSPFRVYEPLVRRKPRIYGRSDRPAWRKIHDEAAMGKKFTKKRDELVAGNNENGYGNAATSDWKDKAWKKAKSIAIDAAKGAVKDGAKHILKNASQRATLKKTVNNRLKELIRPR